MTAHIVQVSEIVTSSAPSLAGLRPGEDEATTPVDVTDLPEEAPPGDLGPGGSGGFEPFPLSRQDQSIVSSILASSAAADADAPVPSPGKGERHQFSVVAFVQKPTPARAVCPQKQSALWRGACSKKSSCADALPAGTALVLRTAVLHCGFRSASVSLFRTSSSGKAWVEVQRFTVVLQ